MISMSPIKKPVRPPSTDMYPAFRFHPDGSVKTIKSAGDEPGEPWASKPFPEPPPAPAAEDPKLAEAKLRVQLAEQQARFDGAWAELMAEKEMAASNLAAAEEQIGALTAEIEELRTELAQLQTQKPKEKKPKGE